ncbi:hypothetical protein [Kitasatospora sp. NPDC088134]|uniref:hypothetical protein n=1 Tax=Kitasatospora sp. NPDC088134 TaxID=3364071 RepID=UPI0038071588
MFAVNECRTLAAELARGGIAATVSGDRVYVEAAEKGRYRRLLLSPKPWAVQWMLVDGHDEELERGFWPASIAVPASAVRHGGLGTPAVVRSLLHARGASVGAPAAPSFGGIVGEEANSWMEVFGLAADHCAEALADGRAPPPSARRTWRGCTRS